MRIHELGHIVFYVSNLNESLHFYRDILGFRHIGGEKGFAVFSSGRTHHELLLIEVGGERAPKMFLKPGFYHAGFKIGTTDDELRDAYAELRSCGVTIVGTGDHTVTHSVYIEDPDGNELELYVDVSEVWKTNPEAIMSPVKSLTL
jgi:catechol 2,3-dioxygenase